MSMPTPWLAINSHVNGNIYRQTSNIRRTLVANKLVGHSDVIGASPVGAAPTTSSFSTLTHGSNGLGKDNSKTIRETLTFLVIWCTYTRGLTVCMINGPFASTIEGGFTNTYEPLNLRALNFYLWTKSTSFNIWVRYSVWNFKGTLWNSTHNISPIHWKIWFVYNI